MKKLFILSVSILSSFSAFSQFSAPVFDTVVTGPQYANDVFYSLQNGTQVASSHTQWDFAFQVYLMQAGIHINATNGVTLYRYPNAAASDVNFTAFDSTGYATWLKLNNSDTTWNTGAFNSTRDFGQPFDYGWGSYNMQSHSVTGDSLFLYKKGNSFKKIWIKNKTANNEYIFRMANLDGSNDVTDTLNCNGIVAKNMIYFSVDNNQPLDVEPPADAWDLMFTRYVAFVTQPSPAYYPVSGVLSNTGVRVAQANGVDTSIVDYAPYTFTVNMSEIGSDWKVFTPPTGPFVITDSLVYFVQSKTNDIWKLIFTGFSGGSTGKYIFSKQKLTNVTSVNENTALSKSFIYPNPLTDSQPLTLVYSLDKNASDVAYTIFDLSGKMISREQVNGSTGLHTQQVSTANLAPGMYLLNLTVDNSAKTLKLIVR